MKSKPPIIWLNVIVFASTFLIALIGVPLYGYMYGFQIEHYLATALALGYAGMSITVGYHRLWAHKTFEAHPVLQVILAIGGAFAVQNSALHWSSDHRVHHKFVDQNDKDPYSAQKGFWFSHIGWLLREYQAQTYDDYSNCRDLQKNKVVMWQHNHYLSIVLATNFGIPLILGIIFNDIWGMLLTVGVLRLVLSHHFTFFINSLAHIWGSQPYTDKNSARDNGWLALLTYGEGYHNYHHIFEADYRNGIRWWQFDPSKWFIKLASYLGLTSNLKKVSVDRIQAAKLNMQKVKTERKVKQLPNASEILELMENEYHLLVDKLKAFGQAKKEYLMAKKQNASKNLLKELKLQYMQLQHDFENHKQQWLQLTFKFT